MAYYYRYVPTLLLPTQDFVILILYLSETRYYPSPDDFLYFFSELLSCPCASALRKRLSPLLQERVIERAGSLGDSVKLGMRLLAALDARAGLLEGDGRVIRSGGGTYWDGDLMTRKKLQCPDGGWEIGWLCQFGSSRVVKVVNRGVSTSALGIKKSAKKLAHSRGEHYLDFISLKGEGMYTLHLWIVVE